jgi:hypothetical protein
MNLYICIYIYILYIHLEGFDARDKSTVLSERLLKETQAEVK